MSQARCATGNTRFAELIKDTRIWFSGEHERKVMRSQTWSAKVVGLVVSLSLTSLAGVAVAADTVSPEPYFNFETKSGEKYVEVAPQSEPYFDFGTNSGEAVAEVAAQSEPYFDFGKGKGEDQAVLTVAPNSERPVSTQTAQSQEAH